MTTATATTLTAREQRALDVLRARYSQNLELFSDKERERLRFLRWLYQTGRVPS